MATDLNMRLRNEILEYSLVIEKYSSLIIQSLLRHIKPESKTLGNKSVVSH